NPPLALIDASNISLNEIRIAVATSLRGTKRMPVIVFSSSKGGCGKTTSSAILGTELALSGATVAMLDADPNKNLVDWATLREPPGNLKVVDLASKDAAPVAGGVPKLLRGGSEAKGAGVAWALLIGLIRLP